LFDVSWVGDDCTEELVPVPVGSLFLVCKDQKQHKMEAAVWKSPVLRLWSIMDFNKGFPIGCTVHGTE